MQDLKTTVADLELRDYGSVAMIEALTETGREWLQENACSEPWQWIGNMLTVEPRYAQAILDGASDDGLEVL